MKLFNIRLVHTSACMLLACSLFLTTATGAQNSLIDRIQAIEDRVAIEELIMGVYPRALDSANREVYASLFARDGVLIEEDGDWKFLRREIVNPLRAAGNTQ